MYPFILRIFKDIMYYRWLSRIFYMYKYVICNGNHTFHMNNCFLSIENKFPRFWCFYVIFRHSTLFTNILFGIIIRNHGYYWWQKYREHLIWNDQFYCSLCLTFHQCSMSFSGWPRCLQKSGNGQNVSGLTFSIFQDIV